MTVHLNRTKSSASASKYEFDAAVENAKLNAMKELAYGASHEINNPLANIAARAQTLLRDEAQPEKRRALAAIQTQAMRAHEMISDLMLFARPPRLEISVVEMRSLLRRCVDSIEAEFDERRIEVQLNLPNESVSQACDPVQMTVAIGALLRNAAESIGANGQIDVTLRAEAADYIEVEVSDDGPGIADHIREHIFDPFFSGREAGRGLGFGLSKCWRIVTEHGGDVVVDSDSRRGAAFTIRLPV